MSTKIYPLEITQLGNWKDYQLMTMEDAWILVAGTVVLIMIYQTVRLRWPEKYFAPADPIDRYVSGTGLRYVLFIVIPPYLVLSVVGVYAHEPSRTILLTAVTYCGYKFIASFVSSIREDGPRFTRGRVGVLLINTVLTLSIAALAIYTHTSIFPYRPTQQELTTALIASVLGAALTSLFILVAGAQLTDSDTRSYALGEETIKSLGSIALENDADPCLIIAIGLAEAHQRPSWVRRIEELPVIRKSVKTRGLYQVKSDKALSDLDSCRIASKALAGNYVPHRDEFSPVEWAIRAAAEIHNPDKNFADMVGEYYHAMGCLTIDSVEEVAADGRPLLEVMTAGRFADRIVLRGTYWPAYGTITADTSSLSSESTRPEVQSCGVGRAGRSAWSLELSAASLPKNVTLTINPEVGKTEERVSINFNLIEQHLDRDLSLRVNSFDYDVL